MKKEFLLLGAVCILFAAISPHIVHAADMCKCSGTVSAGTLLWDSTFDSYCSSMASYCSSCGKGTASCHIEFTSTKEECEKANSEPFSIAESKFGVPSAAKALLSVTIACSFTASKDATDKTSTKATCKDVGGLCVEYSAICDDYKGSISKAGSCEGSEDCCIPSKAEASPAPDVPTGFLRLQLVGKCFGKSGENCTLDDIVSTGANFANLLTSLSAALFFGTFVYGGARYLLSFGRKEWVEAGTKAMRGGAIGMAIVLGAWTLVNYIANSIRGIK